MAGGRGTRFWPKSRRSHPKQVLPLLEEGSLLEATLDRIVTLMTGREVKDLYPRTARAPGALLLEVLRLDGESYRLVASHAGQALVRAEPFDAIELDLGALWAR